MSSESEALVERGEEGPLEKSGERETSDDERVAKLQRSIDASRHQIHDSLERLRGEVERTFDVRKHVDDHPWTAVGLAFAVGFYYGFR